MFCISKIYLFLNYLFIPDFILTSEVPSFVYLNILTYFVLYSIAVNPNIHSMRVPRSSIYYFSSASSHGWWLLTMSSLADLTYRKSWLRRFLLLEGMREWDQPGMAVQLPKSLTSIWKEIFFNHFTIYCPSSNIWFCADISFQLHGIFAFLVYLLLPA